MERKMMRCALLALAMVAAAGPARADWEAVERIEPYAISGTSGIELYQSIGANGPKIGVGRAIAYTNFDLKWSRDYRPQPDGSCVLATARPHLIIIYALPRPSGSLSPTMQRNWDRFIEGIRAHERVHGEDIKDMVRAIEDFSVRDYVGGFEDAQNRLMRLIGDPETRYREDPVRLLRAVRLAAKLDLNIDPATEAPLHTLGPLLGTVSKARLFDETTKLLLSGHGLRSYELLRKYELLGHLFDVRPEDLGPQQDALIRAALTDTDARVAQGLPVTPAFVTAIVLWGAVTRAALAAQQDGQSELPALLRAQHSVLHAQNERMPIPKRFTIHLNQRLTIKKPKPVSLPVC